MISKGNNSKSEGQTDFVSRGEKVRIDQNRQSPFKNDLCHRVWNQSGIPPGKVSDREKDSFLGKKKSPFLNSNIRECRISSFEKLIKVVNFYFSPVTENIR